MLLYIGKIINMQFEWDANKNIKNIEKHGIDFDLASQVFSDDNKIIAFNRLIKDEIRLQIIGKIKNIVIIIVVFTPRNGNIRIISARHANKIERLEYEKQSKS